MQSEDDEEGTDELMEEYSQNAWSCLQIILLLCLAGFAIWGIPLFINWFITHG